MTTTFAAGTRILTRHGEVAIEALCHGDAVETVSGAFRPVVFLGRRRVDCARHPRPRDICPVRIRAGAFADELPSRDLRMSPDHGIYVDDVLVPVRDLINGVTVVQEAVDEVEYWHVELPEQTVIFAEGLPCESDPDGGGRAAFENAGKIIQLYPDFAPPVYHADNAQKASISIVTVTKIRRYLRDRSGQPEVETRFNTAWGNSLPR